MIAVTSRMRACPGSQPRQDPLAAPGPGLREASADRKIGSPANLTSLDRTYRGQIQPGCWWPTLIGEVIAKAVEKRIRKR